MAVKIRLKRRGRKKLTLYDVVIADARAPRDGRFIEKIGTYNPNHNPAHVNLLEEKALGWLLKGAQPTDTVRAMLSYRGILLKKHLQIGVQKEAISQEEADKRYAEWQKQKERSIASKVEQLRQEKEKTRKTRLAAEEVVREKRAIKQAEAATSARVETENAAARNDTTGQASPTAKDSSAQSDQASSTAKDSSAQSDQASSTSQGQQRTIRPSIFHRQGQQHTIRPSIFHRQGQ